MRFLRTDRSKPPQWQFHLYIALFLVIAVPFAWIAFNSWRWLGPTEATAARYRAAPLCADGPEPGCRATVPGTIERAEIRGWPRTMRRQFLTVRFPETIREVEMPREASGRNPQPYPAFQPGTVVTAEWWEDRVVALAAGAVVERTRAHPEEVVAGLREGRAIPGGFVVVLLAAAGFMWWVSRLPARHWEG